MVDIGGIRRDRRQERIIGRQNAQGAAGKKAIHSAQADAANMFDFSEAISAADTRLLEENMEFFVSEIMKQGERLKQTPNKQEFLRYKTLISRFLRCVIDHAFKTGKARQRNHECFFADIIDEKLVELGRYLLLEEADTLALAATIDEIRGLLYDSLKMCKGEQ